MATYTSKKAYMYGTGRRKSSVARVHLFPNGTGSITVNGRPLDDYFGLETLKLIVRQPFAATDTMGKFDVEATVTGRRRDRSGRRDPSRHRPRPCSRSTRTTAARSRPPVISPAIRA